MHRQHIVISINASWNIYNFRMGLIRALLARGHLVTALAPEDEFSHRLEAAGCKFEHIPMDSKGASPVKDLLLYLRYRRILRRLKPDVFLGYTVKPNVYGSMAAQALGIDVVNNVSGLGTVFIRKSLLTTIVKALYRRAFKRSARVFFQNGDDRDLFLHHDLVAREKTALLPGSGIDLVHFTPAVPARKWDAENPVFLMVARLVWDKGVAEFIESARLIKQKIPGARFQLLGFLDVENRTAVSRAAVAAWVAAGVVEYLGDTDDVRPFIAAADCVVLPSYREGTPRTLLEAAAMARPLITTDAPGCREVVEHGCNGYLCAVKDGADLADKMQMLCDLDDREYQAMARESRRIAKNKFDEKLVIEAYCAVLDRLQVRP